MVYHKVHQLQLVDIQDTKEHYAGLASAMTAINLAESAGGKMLAVDLVDIYVHMALRIKASCPNFLQFLHR